MNLKSTLRTVALDAMWVALFAVGFPWLAWRLINGKNRRGWGQKLFGWPSMSTSSHPVTNVGDDGQRIWLHAVSVGEVHLLKSLVEKLEQRNSDFQIHISTTTETGFDRASQLFGDRYEVFFFPFDFSWAIRNVVQRIRPDMLILAELELWPNLIHVVSDIGIPIFVANGRLSENSHRNYHRFRFLTSPMFRKLQFVAAQNETYANRFMHLGCDASRVVVTGNLKYDSIRTDRKNHDAQRCRRIANHFGIFETDSVIVAGSTQIEDEVAAIESWISLRDRFPSLKLIVVPRHPERADEVESLLERHNISANRRSEFESTKRSSRPVMSQSVIIVDVIGELSAWWALADVAFVGGSMGSRGGQNMIEPAAYGIPVCFGPNSANFKTTVDGLLALEAASVVRSSKELADFGDKVLSDSEFANAIGNRAQKYVLQHQGATDRTIDAVERVLCGKARSKSRAA